MDEVREKIKQAIKKQRTNMSAASKAMGRNHAYLQQFIERGTPVKLEEDDRARLAKYLDIPEGDLIPPRQTNSTSGLSDQFVQVQPYKAQPPDSNARDFAYINVYDARASAGGGAWNGRENVISTLSFRLDWLHSITSTPPDKLNIIQAYGDSMSPTIESGDHVLVDSAQSTLRNEGVYIFEYEGGILIKRLAVDPHKKSVRLLSDNKRYPEIEVLNPSELHVVGKAVWIGRKI